MPEISITPAPPALDRVSRATLLLALARRLVRSGAWVALCMGLVLGASGCIHSYQPLSGLHRPVVVDPTQPNFQDVKLTVQCVPGGGLVNNEEARVLCRRVGQLFENQGATVVTWTNSRPVDEDLPAVEVVAESESGESGAVAAAVEELSAPAELSLVLRSRELNNNKNPVSWILCWGTFTLVPAVSERSFATDVEIRDGTGFLLLRDSLQGRIVQHFGIGTWTANKLLDLTWRKKKEKITGDVAERDLSADMYGQLSQLLFNAKMQWQVLQQSPAGRGS